MSNELYQCTAQRLATKNPDTLASDTRVDEASKWFRKTGYDYAPVIEANDPIGFVGIEKLRDEPEKKELNGVLKEIRFKHIISSDANFYDILTGLEEQFFYLIGGKNKVTGILTRADLNASPARIHLFDRITLLETELRSLINEVAPNWKEGVALHPDVVERIERRYERAEQSGIELSEVHYAGFATITKVITHYNDCWRACGYEKSHKASSDLAKIRDLRNDVAHSNRILQTTRTDHTANGRSVRKLIKIYTSITDCNRSLSAR